VTTRIVSFVLFAALFASSASGQDFLKPCFGLPDHAELRAALIPIIRNFPGNAGLGFPVWATVVNRDGNVCAVVFSGASRGDQWPGSRVISAQKANTANAFSLNTFALSTANLYAATQPNGTLFGLQESNPVDVSVAYGGASEDYGRSGDPMVGKKIGGINVFGGGLPLYTSFGQLIGGLGISGETSCSDHIIAWKLRYALNLDNVPAAPAGNARDNMILDIPRTPQGLGASPSGFGHPRCSEESSDVIRDLPVTHPPGPLPPQ